MNDWKNRAVQADPFFSKIAQFRLTRFILSFFWKNRAVQADPFFWDSGHERLEKSRSSG